SVTKNFTLGELVVQEILTRSADGATSTFEYDLANASPSPVFTTITTGSITDNGTVGTVHTTVKQVAMDYDALKSFIPKSKPTGNFTATSTHVKDTSKPAPGTKDTLTVSFNGFTVSPKDKHGARDGSYTHVQEAGVASRRLRPLQSKPLRDIPLRHSLT